MNPGDHARPMHNLTVGRRSKSARAQASHPLAQDVRTAENPGMTLVG